MTFTFFEMLHTFSRTLSSIDVRTFLRFSLFLLLLLLLFSSVSAMTMRLMILTGSMQFCLSDWIIQKLKKFYLSTLFHVNLLVKLI